LFFGVCDGFAEAFDHRRDFAGFGDEGFGFAGFEDFEFRGDVELGSEFAAGAFGDFQELGKFLGSAPLGTLGDIRGDRQCGALDLVFQIDEIARTKLLESLHSQTASPLPDFQILERLIGHGSFKN